MELDRRDVKGRNSGMFTGANILHCSPATL